MIDRGDDLELLHDVQDAYDEEGEGRVVEALAEEPELPPDLDRVLSWFLELGRSRPPNMAELPSAIPFSEMESYYRINGVSEYLTLEEFKDYIMGLDRELLATLKRRLAKDKPSTIIMPNG